MIFSSKNTKLKLSGYEVLARDCSLRISSDTAARFDSKQRRSSSFAAQSGISSSLSFSYYMTVNDQSSAFNSLYVDPVRHFEVSQGEKDDGLAINGSFGGLFFEKGYLSSYSVNFEPNSPVLVSCEIVFFSDLKGSFEVSEEVHDDNYFSKILNCKNAEIKTVDGYQILEENKEFLSASYSYNCEIKPVYVTGKTEPERIYFGRKSSSMNIKVDKDKGNLDYNGVQAGFSVSLKNDQGDDITSLICEGIIQSKSIQASVGEKVNYDLNLISYKKNKKVQASIGVIARENPTLTLIGDEEINLDLNSEYVELGAQASDSIDGDLTEKIKYDYSFLDTSVVGSYLVIYTVFNSANKKDVKRRTIRVLDPKPVQTLIGSSSVSLGLGEEYVELGVTVEDDKDTLTFENDVRVTIRKIR